MNIDISRVRALNTSVNTSHQLSALTAKPLPNLKALPDVSSYTLPQTLMAVYNKDMFELSKKIIADTKAFGDANDQRGTSAAAYGPSRYEDLAQRTLINHKAAGYMIAGSLPSGAKQLIQNMFDNAQTGAGRERTTVVGALNSTPAVYKPIVAVPPFATVGDSRAG